MVSGVRLVISEEENFALGPEMQLQALRSSCGKFYYSKKGIEKASGIDIRRGQRVSHSLVCVGFYILWGFPGSSDGKLSVCNAGDLGLIPGLGRSSGEENGSSLHYSCLENPMNGGAW